MQKTIIDTKPSDLGLPEEWIKLRRLNNWGYQGWALPGRGLGGHFNTVDPKQWLKLQAGIPLDVRWPDKSESLSVPLEVRDFAYTVYDGGFSNVVHSPEYGFTLSVRGVSVWIAINDVEIHAEQLGDAIPVGERQYVT